MQNDKINKLSIKLVMHSKENKELSSKCLALNSNKNSFIAEDTNLENEIEENGKEIEDLNLQSKCKIKVLQNDILHVKYQEETNIKIELEELNEQKLNEQITECWNEIGKYKKLIKELQDQDKEKNDYTGKNYRNERFISDL